jgi:protein-L-isoaspartate(D-aspartate) O-methyltransferase
MVEQQIAARDVEDENVLRAMRSVPRHAFVPSERVAGAYEDHPLPIGYGQTISQPYIVAYMTEIVQLEEGEEVLEVGTGSGYQAAVLAEITPHVYSVEIIEELHERASRVLEEQGYDQVRLRHGDGYYGWEEYATYDAIVVTAAPDHIPQPLVEQLAEGGRMVIPVGPPGAYQALWLVEREGDEVRTERLMGVRFVPLTGEH